MLPEIEEIFNCDDVNELAARFEPYWAEIILEEYARDLDKANDTENRRQLRRALRIAADHKDFNDEDARNLPGYTGVQAAAAIIRTHMLAAGMASHN